MQLHIVVQLATLAQILRLSMGFLPLFSVRTQKYTNLAPLQSRLTESEVKAGYDESVQNTYGRYKMTISHGKGCLLFDLDGKEYLDCTAGIATCCLGHSHPALKKAVSDQMEKVHHVSNLYFIPPQAELAKWLVSTTCGDKAFFCNSGAEANEGAIKLARKYAHNNILAAPIRS